MLRMKCTRSSRPVAENTWAMAAFNPSCASEITSLTPVRPRWRRPYRKSIQNSLALDSPILLAQNLAPPIWIDRASDYGCHRHHPATLTDFEVGLVQPRIRHSPSMRQFRKDSTHSSIPLRSSDSWLFEMPIMPIACTSS